jgi:hypothetical protein
MAAMVEEEDRSEYSPYRADRDHPFEPSPPSDTGGWSSLVQPTAGSSGVLVINGREWRPLIRAAPVTGTPTAQPTLKDTSTASPNALKVSMSSSLKKNVS